MKEKDLRRNASGYFDPTAYEAIKNVENDEKRFHDLLHTLFYICDMAGFDVSERIVLTDRQTGKTWR